VNCRDCGSAIAQERLRARPDAIRCLRCQMALERLPKPSTGHRAVPLSVPADTTEHLEAVEQELRDRPKESMYLTIEGLKETE
jgi:hypothetical protein